MLMGPSMLQILKVVNMHFEKVLISEEIMPHVLYSQDTQIFQMSFG